MDFLDLKELPGFLKLRQIYENWRVRKCGKRCQKLRGKSREKRFFYSRFSHEDDRLPLCGKPSVLHADTTSNQLLLFVARFYARFFRQRHIVGFPCNCNCEKCCVHQMSCFPAVIVKRLYVYQNDFRIQKKITVLNVNVLISLYA